MALFTDRTTKIFSNHMQKINYLGKPGEGFGWGTANTNLVRELTGLTDCRVGLSQTSEYDGTVFVPIVDCDLTPLHKVKRAKKVIGYCFTEWPLGEDAERNARQYDLIFCGSEWNTQKLLRAGIKHVKPLIQGVDHDKFKVAKPSERKAFTVFSGGKYEYRKGQDYVIAAMKHFMRQHSDVVLITAWNNLWPQTMASMRNSWLVNFEKPLEGLPLDRVIALPQIASSQMPEVYSHAHVGLFPNRCEAGTNLVMSELMACGRPVIASYATGQADVLTNDALLLTNGSYDAAGWFNPNVSDIIAHLEYAYSNRSELKKRGEACAQNMKRFTWKACAESIVAEL